MSSYVFETTMGNFVCALLNNSIETLQDATKAFIVKFRDALKNRRDIIVHFHHTIALFDQENEHPVMYGRFYEDSPMRHLATHRRALMGAASSLFLILLSVAVRYVFFIPDDELKSSNIILIGVLLGIFLFSSTPIVRIILARDATPYIEWKVTARSTPYASLAR